MKINPFNSISFKSTPLYDVKLKKQNPDGTMHELPAVFSELHQEDKEDEMLIKNIRKSWDEAYLGFEICDDFLYGNGKWNNFYVIEKKDDTGKKEVFSIAEFSKNWNSIRYLQANPKNGRAGIKGSGEVMLWGIGKEKMNNSEYECFHLSPVKTSEEFYKHMGLQKVKDNLHTNFYLSKSNAEDFLHRIEKKYGFEGKRK